MEAASNRLRTIAIRDLGMFQGATLAGTTLFTAAPPGVVLSEQQRRSDEDYEKSLIPSGGMPSDVKLEMRVINTSRQNVQ